MHALVKYFPFSILLIFLYGWSQHPSYTDEANSFSATKCLEALQPAHVDREQKFFTLILTESKDQIFKIDATEVEEEEEDEDEHNLICFKESLSSSYNAAISCSQILSRFFGFNKISYTSSYRYIAFHAFRI